MHDAVDRRQSDANRVVTGWASASNRVAAAVAAAASHMPVGNTRAAGYGTARYGWLENAHLHTRQNVFLHVGQSSLRLSASHANAYVQPALGQLAGRRARGGAASRIRGRRVRTKARRELRT